ncbi:MAG: hypothetical protein ACK53T_17680 [Planctomycetota bacterium]|jgi:hypothetical protein
MAIALTLDTWDPLSTNRPQVHVTDEDTGGHVNQATVTLTVRRDDGTDAGVALGAPLNVPLTLPHTSGGIYRASVPPTDSASAGITLATVRTLLLDYVITVSGSPASVLTIRQTVRVARTRDEA